MSIAIVGVGAVASGTTSITPPYPAAYTAVADHIAITYMETESEIITAPTNWAQVTTINIATGTITRLSAFWRRLTAGEAAPAYATTANHKVGRMIVCSGCVTSGNPWDTLATGTDAVVSTAVSVPAVNTTVTNTLILAAFSTGQDTANTTALSWTNAGLTSVTHQMANWVVDGLGGGFALCTGVKATAGATGATTTTMATTANVKTMMTIALKEQPATPSTPPINYAAMRALLAR